MNVPTVVIVPAACQPPSLYSPFTKALESQNIPSCVIPTPSVGAKPGLKDFSADLALVRETVTKLLDDGTDVIVLMHSYGGIPGSAALQGLGKTDRVRAGNAAGVVRLVYVCSFALREGERMPDAGNLELLRERASEGLDEEAGTLLVTPKAAAFVLFDEVPQTEREHYSSLLKPHSIGAMWSSQTYAAWQDIPSTYVLCELDRVMPVQRQKEMINNARDVQPKAFDVVERLNTGHEPILTKIDDLVKIVENAAERDGSW